MRWKLRNNYGGDGNDKVRNRLCENEEKEGCGGLSQSPSGGKTIVVLATPLSPQDVYDVCMCLQGCLVPNVRYHLLKHMEMQLPALCSSAAGLAACSLFSGNRLVHPLIPIHPSCAPVYKREIRISITWAKRHCDWWVSHRIPSVLHSSLCFRSEKWTLSRAMIRFSRHISI